MVAVVGAVVPFMIQGQAQSRGLQQQAVVAAIGGPGAITSDDLGTLTASSGLSGAALVSGDRVEIVGDPEPAIEELIALCPPGVLSPTPLGWVDYQGYEVHGACTTAGDGRIVVARMARGWRSSGRTRQIFFMALVFGTLAGGVVAGTVRRVLEPLESISEAARGLAVGESVQLETPADPELRPLVDALLQLSVAMQAREDDIQLRLELTRQLGAVVAHEVRNPMQSIMMLADVVAHEPDAAERSRVLTMIQQELGLIEEVVHRLVDSGGELRLVLREHRVANILERCVKLAGPAARERNVEVALVNEHPVQAEVDAALLRRAVENLVHNAVAIRAQAGGGRVELALHHPPGELLFSVDDDGDGVDPENRERIFEAGFSAREGGTGLGLALARKVAEAHGGTLDVLGSDLGGARFELRVPVKSDA